jgi:hypothetical protein
VVKHGCGQIVVHISCYGGQYTWGGYGFVAFGWC